MDLSIIIVNWNTCRMLSDCLASIKDSCGKLDIEIFVVDNDSSDGSREMVQKDFPEVHLINSGGNIGFARANNLAIPKATAPFVLFLNPDTIVNHDMLQKMYGFLVKHPETGVVSCKSFDEDGIIAPLPIQIEITPFKRFLIQIFSSEKSDNILSMFIPAHSPNKSGYVRLLYGYCLMVRKDALDSSGYFDEQYFMYVEDVDLCDRIYKKGWRLYYMSEVSLIHLCGQASRKAPKAFSILTMCESISKFMTKNYGAKGAVIYKTGVLISSISRLAILSILMGIDFVGGRSRKLKYEQSWYKNAIMLKWSLAFI